MNRRRCVTAHQLWACLFVRSGTLFETTCVGMYHRRMQPGRSSHRAGRVRRRGLGAAACLEGRSGQRPEQMARRWVPRATGPTGWYDACSGGPKRQLGGRCARDGLRATGQPVETPGHPDAPLGWTRRCGATTGMKRRRRSQSAARLRRRPRRGLRGTHGRRRRLRTTALPFQPPVGSIVGPQLSGSRARHPCSVHEAPRARRRPCCGRLRPALRALQNGAVARRHVTPAVNVFGTQHVRPGLVSSLKAAPPRLTRRPARA